MSFIYYVSLFLLACGDDSATLNKDSLIIPAPVNPPANQLSSESSYFRLSLTSSNESDFNEVHIFIEKIELWVKDLDTEESLVIIKNNISGDINLKQLQNGMLKTLTNIEISDNLILRQIRIKLNNDNHYAISKEGDLCALQTPSAEKSGLKINFTKPLVLEKNFAYMMIIDFEADRSIVKKGNGDCLLKPVLHVEDFVRVSLDDLREDDIQRPIIEESETPEFENPGLETGDDTISYEHCDNSKEKEESVVYDPRESNVKLISW